MQLEELNSKFGKTDRINFALTPSGLIHAKIQSNTGSRAIIYLYGAHLTSWRNSSGEEILYLSPKAEFTAGKAIRGGIPVIFPQFGPGKLPSHGFARNKLWRVVKSSVTDKFTSLTMALSHSAELNKIWPYKFSIEIEVRLSSSLTAVLRVKNEDDKPLEFQCALHTYFEVSDIQKVALKGFSGLKFLDNLKAKSLGQESRSVLTFNEEIDRVYLNAPNELIVEDAGLNRSVTIAKNNLPDAVVWNPWQEKGASLADLESDGYKKFICVETGAIGTPVKLLPGETFEGWQELAMGRLELPTSEL